MFYHKDFKSLVIWWNNSFPADKWWRDKHNIPFNSSKHRETSQVDIYFEYLEEKLFKKFHYQYEQEELMKNEFEKGNILKEEVLDEKEIDSLIENADFSFINSGIDVQ